MSIPSALRTLQQLVFKRPMAIPIGQRSGGPELQLDMERDEAFMAAYEVASPFTLTTMSRMYALHLAVRYVVDTNVRGEIVECGVWQGGSMMLCASTLLQLGTTERQLRLYDTFEGMPPPSSADVDILGRSATALLKSEDTFEQVACRADLETVAANLGTTSYPTDRCLFIKGRVEETIPQQTPDRIAILRLDTDWYESTLHELVHLYPLVSPGGVVIIDDYGHWDGARRAVDEYLGSLTMRPLVQRVDYSGRMFVRPG